jgi:hypothetical protein
MLLFDNGESELWAGQDLLIHGSLHDVLQKASDLGWRVTVEAWPLFKRLFPDEVPPPEFFKPFPKKG